MKSPAAQAFSDISDSVCPSVCDTYASAGVHVRCVRVRASLESGSIVLLSPLLPQLINSSL